MKRQPIFLEGRRIVLRDLRISDVDTGYLRWMNDPEVNQYLESRFQPVTREGLEQFIVRMNSDDENAFFAIVAKDTDRHIGNIKAGPINWVHHTADIGLVIGEKAYWRKGIAAEAISLIAAYAFDQLKLHKLTAGCYSNNPSSARAFEKVGFVREGLRHEQFRSNGTYVDQILLGLIRPK